MEAFLCKEGKLLHLQKVQLHLPENGAVQYTGNKLYLKHFWGNVQSVCPTQSVLPQIRIFSCLEFLGKGGVFLKSSTEQN